MYLFIDRDKNNTKKERTTSGRRQLTSEKVKAISLKLRFESLFSGTVNLLIYTVHELY